MRVLPLDHPRRDPPPERLLVRDGPQQPRRVLREHDVESDLGRHARTELLQADILCHPQLPHIVRRRHPDLDDHPPVPRRPRRVVARRRRRRRRRTRNVGAVEPGRGRVGRPRRTREERRRTPARHRWTRRRRSSVTGCSLLARGHVLLPCGTSGGLSPQCGAAHSLGEVVDGGEDLLWRGRRGGVGGHSEASDLERAGSSEETESTSGRGLGGDECGPGRADLTVAHR